MDLSPLLPSPSPGIVNLLVVNPAGSRHLYGYNPDPGLLELRRVLDSSIRHPFDHGFVPNTRVASSGPLAAMVITSEPIFSGCLVRARPIGLLELVEDGANHVTLLCIPEADSRQNAIRSIRQIAPVQLEEVAEFFRTYKSMEGRVVEILDWLDVDAVPALIERCSAAAQKA